MPEVRIVAGDSAFTLGDEHPVTVPARDLVLMIEDAPHVVTVDGTTRRPTLAGTTGVIPMPMGRSTGFHYLRVGASTYWFATEDAKLRLDGLLAMLRELRGEELAWAGQILFSDGSLLRDPHVVYGWLDAHAALFLDALETAARNPDRGRHRTLATTRFPTRPVDVPATIRLLRRSPAELLEPHPTGPVKVGQQSYVPRKVKVSTSGRTFDTPANRRMVYVTDQVVSMCREVLAVEGLPQDVCREWARRAHHAIATSPLRALHGTRFPPTQTGPETHAPPYQRSFISYRSLTDDMGWAPNSTPTPTYSYVHYADEVFQAYAAYCVASALGMRPTASVLGSSQPAFTGNGFRLFVNVEPPHNVIRHWRQQTTPAAVYRPDLTLQRSASGEVALIDAKYRDFDTGAEGARKEAMAYLAAFGVQRVGIIYPLDVGAVATTLHHTQNGIRAILELGLRPVDPADGARAGLIQQMVAELLRPPRWLSKSP